MTTFRNAIAVNEDMGADAYRGNWRRAGRAIRIALVGILLICGVGQGADAQEAPPPRDQSAVSSTPTDQTPAVPRDQLEEIIVTARRVRENEQNIPVVVSTLTAQTLDQYDVSSLEKAAALTPGLIITRGNSGSGADISLRGIGSSFSSIGIEQSVAIIVDGVYYGQGRVIDEGFVDLDQMEILKGPQALFFGKNSTAGVISITSADPGPKFESMARIDYEFGSQTPMAEAIVSGPVTDEIGLRLVVSGDDMLGGYVRNDAPAGTYTTTDAATGTSTDHFVPAPSNPDLPADRSILARFTATYRPNSTFDMTVKATIDHNLTGGTSWSDTLWKCPGGVNTLPGNGDPCGNRFTVEQNPAPPEIAATRPDMGRFGGQLYALYDSHGVTAKIDETLESVTLSSITNYQYFAYSANSDYDFTSLPLIWADQDNSYSAFSEEARAQTSFGLPVNFLAGLYFQRTNLNFAQASVLYGVENSVAPTADRYIGFAKLSETTGETLAGYGQVVWKFLPDWEFTAGARYTDETKNSFFVQPYVAPFFAAIYPANERVVADQHFHNISPEATLTWKPDSTLTLYAAFKTGYKSGGFSNSTSISIFETGVKDLAFKPETVQGGETGVKATLLDQRLRLNLDAYDYDFSDLQVDFYNSRNLALITTNAGSAITKGLELEAEFLPPNVGSLKIQGSAQYNLARYQDYLGPCYAGETQAQGCNLIGPAPDFANLQNLHGRPTADAPKWTGAIGADYSFGMADRLVVDLSADLRYSSSYSVSPFGEPLDMQASYVNLDAAIRISAEQGSWQLALIGKNLTNNFVVTSAFDESSTGTASGGKTGTLANQFALFAPPRTVELQLTYRY
jgi:iron complex outermembrane recepter protein